MAANGPWVATNAFRTNLLNGTHDLDSDSWKVGLYLSTSNISASSTTIAGVTNEHAAANGYSAGGITVSPLVLSGSNPVNADFTTDPVWTATGGSIVARYAVLFEAGGVVAAFMLLDATPADVTVTAGNNLTLSTPTGLLNLA